MKKDPYLKRFCIRVSGLRNWLWGLLTLGLKYTQITHKVIITDAKGNIHELYRKYRKIFYVPGKKYYCFRFKVFIPRDFEPQSIQLFQMHPGNSTFILRNGMTFRYCPSDTIYGWHDLYDMFTWEEISENED